MDEICTCGHTADDHGAPWEGDDEGVCIEDCPCIQFELDEED